MKILHLTPKDYKTALWSGGTTTEIFLWPPEGSYATREFTVRISSAQVDLPESDFTALPGVQRWITPLTGGFTLTHPGKPPITLAPLEYPYHFSGQIPTHCQGTARDFNLMCKGVPGSMAISREMAPVKPGFQGFYALEAGDFHLDGRVYPMEAGDFLGVFSREHTQIQLTAAITCWADIS